MRASHSMAGLALHSIVVALVLSCLAPALGGTIVPDPVLPDPSGINKNRYLSIVLPETGGTEEAILVTIVHLPETPGFDGLQLWVGPTFQEPDFPDEFTAARFQCHPYFNDWTTTGLLHIHSAEIQPRGVYAVQRVDISCPDLSDPACYSAPITVRGAKFGDIDLPFEGPGVATQPDAFDMTAITQKFLGDANAPIEPQSEIVVILEHGFNNIALNDIAVQFDAVQGQSYGVFAGLDSACVCPSTVVCGTPCEFSHECDGVCIVDTCFDDCGRCSVAVSVCGDGIVDTGEQCDDGGTDPGDGCNHYCQFEYTCGNNVTEPGEACDDGNVAPNDGCDEFCQLEGLCGNGARDSGEFCDDGNTADGDGCDSLCRIEPACGNGIVEHLEECDDGNVAPGDGCGGTCLVEERSVVVQVVPVPPSNGTSYPTDVVIDGSEILLSESGIRLWFELRLSGWGPAGIETWQATFTRDGFDQDGVPGVEFAHEPCLDRYSCWDDLGYAMDCLNRTCNGGERDGSPCSGISSQCPDGSCEGSCSPTFYDKSEFSDFYTMTRASFTTERARISYAAFWEPVEDPGVEVNGGTLVLDVQPDATGSYTVDLDHRLDATFLSVVEADERRIAPIAEFRPATITITEACAAGPTAPLAETTPVAKSRYFTLRPDESWSGRRVALRVTPLVMPGLEAFEGIPLWVGAPAEYPDENSAAPGQTFTAAGLQCSPQFVDWSTIGEFSVYGAEILPGGQYEVQAVELGCNLAFDSGYSEPLTIVSGAFGDAVSPFGGEGTVQPDFRDITALLSKFLANPESPSKALTQLQPSVVRPSRPIDFNDIATVVTAFLGVPYPDAIDAVGCACPTVKCGVTPCTRDSQCGDGLCIDDFCTDACGRCSP